MEKAHIISIQVGLPKWIRSGEPEFLWLSGIFKESVKGPVWLGKTNLSGDGQADLEVHGGPDKAVLAYAACHYPFWSEAPPPQVGASLKTP
jgi:MOSC domain-containing protein YiiM